MRAPVLGYEELGGKGGDMGGEDVDGEPGLKVEKPPGVELLPRVADSGERVK